ncbi:MAG: hypothetical protein FWC16_14055 [Defluviitaleaceae bacterium]|nr:hypothetical protein [Defluviitaleaceae bacterium]MCL2276036.1 hypothetical protein [Defluviitaleaceae bacterium]
MDFILIVIVFLACGLTAIFVHELGHAFMSRLLHGDKNWYIVIGAGTTLLETKWLMLNTRFYAGGLCRYSASQPEKWRLIMRSAGGVLANIIFTLAFSAVIIFIMVQQQGAFVFMHMGLLPHMLIVANVFIIIFSLLPIPYPFGIMKGMPSDGLTIIRILRGDEERSSN